MSHLLGSVFIKGESTHVHDCKFYLLDFRQIYWLSFFNPPPSRDDTILFYPLRTET
jgi:hypothetical protein